MKKENDMAEAKALAAVPEATEEKESTVRQRLVGKAMIALREAHREEFDQIAGEFFRKEGLTYKRRLNEQEKASEQIIAIARKAGLDVTIQAGLPAEDRI